MLLALTCYYSHHFFLLYFDNELFHAPLEGEVQVAAILPPQAPNLFREHQLSGYRALPSPAPFSSGTDLDSP